MTASAYPDDPAGVGIRSRSSRTDPKCRGDTWLPSIAPGRAPYYVRLADALASDIDRGRLTDGARLPSQRALARSLGVTIGTITRGFAEARRRGLLVCETGRGSYVRKSAPLAHEFGLPTPVDASILDLGPSSALRVDTLERDALRQALAAIQRRLELPSGLPPATFTADPRLRKVITAQLLQLGLPVRHQADVILVCQGAQQAIAAVFGAIASPGDVILVEALTYPGIKRLAEVMRLRLHPVRLDRHGLDPAALDSACRKLAPRALYCVPTLNPATATLMPDARRREVAEVLRRHGTLLLEDDDDSCIATAPPPLAAHLPGNAVYLLDSTKLMLPGLRLAWLVAPAGLARTLTSVAQTLSWTPAAMQIEIGTQLLEQGHCARIIAARRQGIAERHAILRRELPRSTGFRYTLPRGAHHVWLELGSDLRADDVVAAALQRGVRIVGPQLFIVPPATAPRAIRVSLSAEADPARLARGLAELRALLAR